VPSFAGRYRVVVCAVNCYDNSHGIISQLARALPTSQWAPEQITEHAKTFSTGSQSTRVVRFDMDVVEVLAVCRPPEQEAVTLENLTNAFHIIEEMIRRRSDRIPAASVSFLGARANRLVDQKGEEPSFETVLRTMYETGFSGDVYPAPRMWQSGRTAVYPRYPFPASVESMRQGGF